MVFVAVQGLVILFQVRQIKVHKIQRGCEAAAAVAPGLLQLHQQHHQEDRLHRPPEIEGRVSSDQRQVPALRAPIRRRPDVPRHRPHQHRLHLAEQPRPRLQAGSQGQGSCLRRRRLLLQVP